VNELFGATALCYTLYGNYYVEGGLINLVRPLEAYLREHGSSIRYRHSVKEIIPLKDGYEILSSGGTYQSRFVISGIPLNDTLNMFQDDKVRAKLQRYTMPSEMLNGAFTMGLVVRDQPPQQVLHHQVHVPEGLPYTGSKSFFVSFSHPDDHQRAPKGETVVAISTHVPDPVQSYIADKQPLEEAILEVMERQGLLCKKQIVYRDSATPGAWIFWTQRAYGMVGGYPQYSHVKPWQMKDARLDQKGAYLCGDTVYPGQGIVGTCLSGIIAVHKLLQDHF
jgi:phytoene dehydrogenase-like protein